MVGSTPDSIVTVDIVFSFSFSTSSVPHGVSPLGEAIALRLRHDLSGVIDPEHGQCERLDIPSAFDRVLEAA
jgi:hypothetical protein